MVAAAPRSVTVCERSAKALTPVKGTSLHDDESVWQWDSWSLPACPWSCTVETGRPT